MSDIVTGRCHCGAVRYEIELENGLGPVRRCNCSLCRRKGAMMAFVAKERLRITAGEGTLSEYRWNTDVARHYFCRICGIYTHHQRRMAPSQYGFNVACLENIDLDALVEDARVDGASLSGEIP